MVPAERSKRWVKCNQPRRTTIHGKMSQGNRDKGTNTGRNSGYEAAAADKTDDDDDGRERGRNHSRSMKDDQARDMSTVRASLLLATILLTTTTASAQKQSSRRTTAEAVKQKGFEMVKF
ncbi:MAG TPA: hypothetical protein VGD87_08610, partial [Archangium sp.]